MLKDKRPTIDIPFNRSLRPFNPQVIYSQHEPICANSAQLQDFSDYIQSIPQWINLLIRNYTVHPLQTRSFSILLIKPNFSYPPMVQEPTTKVVAVGSLS